MVKLGLINHFFYFSETIELKMQHDLREIHYLKDTKFSVLISSFKPSTRLTFSVHSLISLTLLYKGEFKLW